MTRRNFHLGAALIVALALLVRLVCQLGTEPLVHIAGHINDYVRYAWNLGQYEVYSSASINPDATPTPTFVIAAGLAFGSVAQADPFMLLFPALVAVALLSMRCRKQALALLAAFLALPLGR